MPPVIPDPARIRPFPTQAAFEAWLSAHHDRERELWLLLYKKNSGVQTVTYAEALEVALCWGWIDGLKKSWDNVSFLQRFTPRGPKSLWSRINRDHVARLVAEGRMTPFGQAHVEAAIADGRWEAAYAGGREMEMPADLLTAIEADPDALSTFQTLDRTNRYAIAWRVHTLKTEAGRAKRIAALVEMLGRGETLHPVKSKA
jgi:uncharacterized protein YdeI (YjbR/CyaY-like superfamily)